MTRCPKCRSRVDETFTSHCPECGTSVTSGVESMTVLRPDLSDQPDPRAAQRAPADPTPPPAVTPPPPPPTQGLPPARNRPSGVGRFARGVGIRVIIAAVVLGGGALYGAFTDADRNDTGAVVDDGTVSAFDLQVGDCIEMPDAVEDEFSSVRAVPCADPHDAELYALAIHPAGDDVPWPGSGTISDWSVDACYGAFAGYVGRSYEEAQELDFTFFTPTELGWSKQDDRVVQCLVVRVDGAKLIGPIASA